MSYYDPIYYPYYSARRAYAESTTAEIQHRIRILADERQAYDRAEFQSQIRQQQQQLCRLRLQQYEAELKAKQRLDRVIREQAVISHMQQQNFIKAREEEALHLSYLSKIDKLKQERDLLDSTNFKNSHLSKYDSYLHDDILIDNYESGRRAQQYQQSLLEKINQTKNKSQQASAVKDKSERKQSASKAQQGSNDKYEGFKRSYIDQLRQNKNCSFSNDAIASNLKRSPAKQVKIIQEPTKFNGDTRQDLKSHTLNVALTHSGYQSSAKKPKCDAQFYQPASNRNPRYSKNKSKSVSNKNTFVRNPGNHSLRNDSAASEMMKIKNRLNVSTIVYRDSKMRNAKHQTDHLYNTYMNELKGRQYIKNKINSHHSILKKHAMVVAQ